ncbi:MFS transporter [Ensifer sp. PDNC004]|uniref:MFS transporter n=1 Tax=Ensifer sp. PDNC004 TaxID=2811423 RepID=UPI0019645436|nr:MFS transporter [Ensifer sp. PDNC004]QRY68586.1 MFS transporter [Ensifer sp. PDNC004]
MAIEALALDIMLPALPEIGAASQVSDPNDRSLVLTVFLIGFGLPQVLFGPLSDRFGRRPPILIGLAVYIACARLARHGGLCSTAVAALDGEPLPLRRLRAHLFPRRREGPPVRRRQRQHGVGAGRTSILILPPE